MFFRGWVHVLLGTEQGIHLDNFQLKLKFKLGFNKLTVNGTKSSEVVHSDLGDHSDGGGGGYSDLVGSFRFAGSVVEVKCLSASGFKTILSEAKLQK